MVKRQVLRSANLETKRDLIPFIGKNHKWPAADQNVIDLDGRSQRGSGGEEGALSGPGLKPGWVCLRANKGFTTAVHELTCLTVVMSPHNADWSDGTLTSKK